jgi:hypothetical protein
MKRLVVTSLAVLAAMVLAPSVAAQTSPARSLPIRTAPIVRTSPIARTSPIVRTSPIAVMPARWSYMWLRAVKIAPALAYAPMPHVERTAALRTNALRRLILKLHAQAR